MQLMKEMMAGNSGSAQNRYGVQSQQWQNPRSQAPPNHNNHN